MVKFQYKILAVSEKNFAFFECSNGDYGILEPLDFEVSVNDVLCSLKFEIRPSCGSQIVVLNGRDQVKVLIDELGKKDVVYKLFKDK